MLTISDNDFKRLYTFIRENYGIDLSQKKQLIMGRLSNDIMAKGYPGFTEYVNDILTKATPSDIDGMLNRLTTNYTFFMREEEHFTFFRDTILPYLEQKKKDHVLSIWSAGCSTGQEPYTISMLLKEYFGGKGYWDTRILATDISQNALTAAQNAQYDEESLSRLPAAWKTRYFEHSRDTGLWTVKPSLQSNVIFKTFNLMDPIRFKLKFDVIFCRNVMIYFDQATKDSLVDRFYDATAPGGYLLIGHSESLNKTSTRYDYIMPATYRKTSGS
nr:protein-glutamate O-methyltransferase CheR [uncultured Eisenbergiella sp.]